MRPILVATVLLAAIPAAGHAQHTPSPHAGDQDSEVKTLTAAEVAGLRAGDGMGLARPGELNGYPGPRHVLDLADSLHLDPDQARATERLFDSMRERAIAAGEAVIAAERDLDALFASGSVDHAALERSLQAVAEARAALSAVHLRAHLAMRDVLTRHQVREYARLRGYADGHGHD